MRRDERKCLTNADLDEHALAGGLIDQQGKWRLVADPFGGDYPWPQFQLSSGEWVWPDCGYICSKCDTCLGCERKFIREQGPDGTWFLNTTRNNWPPVGCDDGGEHECAGEDEDEGR